jgi:ribonuclease HI
MKSKVTLFADGGSRGNPGPAAGGAVLVDERGAILQEVGVFIGVATNNVAEWQGLIVGLRAALDAGIEELSIRLDSELVVRQVSGVYRVKQPDLLALHKTVRGLLAKFKSTTIAHVPRADNKEADAVVNRTLDAALKAKS